jgi:drug/metabolite transporter (DMT)-like permease
VNGSQAAAGLGLLSAGAWGGSDFLGGVGAKRAPALLVVASGQILTMIVLLALCLGLHVPVPGRLYMACALAGGFEGAISLALFYRALAQGAMGLTAALTGLLTALVPVAFALFHDGLPGRVGCAGLIAGLFSIWLITRSPAASGKAASATGSSGTGTPAAALLLGALAGAGFGVQMILFKIASAGGVLWTMTLGRVAGVTALLLVLAVIRPGGSGLKFLPIGILAGVLDTAGNGFYIWAASFGRLEAAAVISSLYPGVTIALAALVLREWPARRQVAGIALALVAVVLLSI